jgi:hypothetical protein
VQSVQPVDFTVGFVKSVDLFVKSEMLFEKPSSLSVPSVHFVPGLQLSVHSTMWSLLSALKLLIRSVVLSFALLLCL